MSLISPVLTGISSAVGDVSSLGGMVLLVFVGIMAGRVTAAPVRSRRSRYSSSPKTVSYVDNKGGTVSKAEFDKLQKDFYERYKPDNRNQKTQRNYSPKYKKQYQKKKSFTGRVKNISARSGYLRSGVVKADAGPHSKRLAAHNAAVAQSNRDFKHWQKNASPAELNKPAIRRARPGEY